MNAMEPWFIMNAKIKMRLHVIFNKPHKFDTADIKCFTVYVVSFSLIQNYFFYNAGSSMARWLRGRGDV